MFSRYRKDERAIPVNGAPKAPPATTPAGEAAAAPIKNESLPRPLSATASSRRAAQATPADKELRRKQKMNELKVALHKELLEQLNLAALESASEKDLRMEIAEISAEMLSNMSVVLNKDDRRVLNDELYDEVRH